MPTTLPVDVGDTPPPLSEEECWALINLLDWSFENQDDEMPTEVTFESLLYLPQEAFMKKTGKEMVYIPPFNFETYGNKKGWGRQP